MACLVPPLWHLGGTLGRSRAGALERTLWGQGFDFVRFRDPILRFVRAPRFFKKYTSQVFCVRDIVKNMFLQQLEVCWFQDLFLMILVGLGTNLMIPWRQT